MKAEGKGIHHQRGMNHADQIGKVNNRHGAAFAFFSVGPGAAKLAGDVAITSSI